MGDWSQDGDVENNERKTLPERQQRSHWKFNYKYTRTSISKYLISKIHGNYFNFGNGNENGR
jgi:hypothetical protein